MTSAHSDDIPRYSTSALSALNQFHDCNCMVFVEGSDDELFWEMICECAEMSGVRIESVGGRTQLDEYTEKILTENAPIIVACDSDYSTVLRNGVDHPQIVRTYGYSIENTMYCPPSLNRFVRKLARSRRDFTPTARAWLDEFCESSQRLLVFAVANERYAKGISVFPDSCARFLTSRHSEKLSPTRIEEYLDSIANEFSDRLACPRSMYQLL